MDTKIIILWILANIFLPTFLIGTLFFSFIYYPYRKLRFKTKDMQNIELVPVIRPENKRFGPRLLFTSGFFITLIIIAAYSLFLIVSGQLDGGRSHYSFSNEPLNMRIPATITAYILFICIITFFIGLIKILIEAYTSEVKILDDRVLFKNKFNKLEILYSQLESEINVTRYPVLCGISKDPIFIPELNISFKQKTSMKKLLLYAYYFDDAEKIKEQINLKFREMNQKNSY